MQTSEVKCSQCDGAGDYEGNKDIPCPTCSGTGKVGVEEKKEPETRDDLLNELWSLWESMAECGELKIGPKFSANYERLKRRVSEREEEPQEELQRLRDLINHPEIEDFLKGVQLEAAHQTERWGPEDEQKPPHHFVMVVTKIAGKMCMDVWDKDVDKFKHHCIALAAEMFNVHRQIKKEGTEINKWFKP